MNFSVKPCSEILNANTFHTRQKIVLLRNISILIGKTNFQLSMSLEHIMYAPENNVKNERKTDNGLRHNRVLKLPLTVGNQP